ncbi:MULTISPECIES: helix-turn-helix transcriptional regulator [Desulfovibrio]|uniref:helix-turn-helix transcriptional regulator n=1 Tax=Desulfovibrio TaxID=872 RepID=UPI0026EE12C8|nr:MULTISPECIES: AlpA family phage regulatory protein [Desulfovibrio]MCI7616715.1 AlpA family phage regulatory protein [Desulfovibrio piger]MDY4807689.1 AlpA family phage regulatory protein [Desulfovibrio sp.]
MPATVQKPSAPVLPETGFLRLADVLKIVPVCRTAWYNGVKSGLYPKPVALGKRARGYRIEDVRALIDRLNAGEGA